MRLRAAWRLSQGRTTAGQSGCSMPVSGLRIQCSCLWDGPGARELCHSRPGLLQHATLALGQDRGAVAWKATAAPRPCGDRPCRGGPAVWTLPPGRQGLRGREPTLTPAPGPSSIHSHCSFLNSRLSCWFCRPVKTTSPFRWHCRQGWFSPRPPSSACRWPSTPLRPRGLPSARVHVRVCAWPVSSSPLLVRTPDVSGWAQSLTHLFTGPAAGHRHPVTSRG